jgi:hypothetical protein
MDQALWVVDGQQRITSLANALHPDGRRRPDFAISYDLTEKQFISTPDLPDPTIIPLHVLFDLDALLVWFAENGAEIKELFAEARRVAKKLQEFKVPAYLVQQNDENILKDIFDRMNNYGKRLSRAEIFSALFSGAEAGHSERLNINRISEHVSAETGFGTIDNDTILRAILARRGPDPTREIRIEFDDSVRRSGVEFPGEDAETAYEEGEKALLAAVRFLQQSAGVPHISMLTYRFLLISLARFFAHFPHPEEQTITLLRRVFWRVSIAGPTVHKGSLTEGGRLLCSRIRPGDEWGSVKGMIAVVDSQPSAPSPRRLRTNEAAGKIILCSWWALRPRSPITGDVYRQDELSSLLAEQTTAAEALPRIFSRKRYKEQQLWAANRLFIPSASEPIDEIPSLLATKPSDITAKTWSQVIASHSMTAESAALLADNKNVAFLEARDAEIQKNLLRFLENMTEWASEDTPPLDILNLDDLEDPDELRSDELI